MFLDYDMPLYRPPSEGANLIIQATLGCSFNHCAFCSMYKSKDFRARPLEDILSDIDEAAEIYPDAHRIFLADGDALVLPMETLVAILDRLAEKFSSLARVSCYATPINLMKKTSAELDILKARSLNLLYFGIETGSDVILKKISKGATSRTLVESLEKARAAEMKVSATVILGLAGKKLWKEHMDGTADVINRAAPTFLSTLQLTLEDSLVEDYKKAFDGDFEYQDDDGILAEQAHLIAALEPSRPIIFRSNHASNCLPLAGNLPKDKDRILQEIALARDGQMALRSKFMRGF
jgi:radical SAM superfamily enzyme YgiQ (UPF0313 family)